MHFHFNKCQVPSPFLSSKNHSPIVLELYLCIHKFCKVFPYSVSFKQIQKLPV